MKKIYKIKKGFITQKMDDKTVIFDGEKFMIYTLNEAASFMFSKLKSGWDKEKIIRQMMKKYQVKKETLEKDYGEFIQNLLKKKILE